MTINEGKLLIEQKVEDFNKNEKQYLSKTFQETEVRTRFIDPFFQALGWDFNQTNISKHLWDVHREYSQKDNSNTKKPDYAFNISGKLKFFVEAKAPWVLLTDKVPVFQAKRYAYSTNGKAPVVIITDFQEFRVFNAIERPIFDNPLQGLIKELDLKYNNYLTKWDLIYGNFSKEAVMSGSIDKLIGKITKETKTLDKEFLSDLIIFRELLAKNIAIRNKELSVDIINECVQRILDRIIFIRNIEDRDIENEILFKISESKDNVYKSLLPVFSKLNDDYNGLLFKPDISDKVIIDDDIIRKIIKNLYPPHSPFQFDIIEPEILGRIYEKFLGSKIRLTESHQAKVEEKPEVRHAGGVFYTPQFIVENIVFNTVGKILTENKMTPEDVEKIKILDPACGSGSFLLGAFDYLIKYHENWYRNNKSSRKYKDDFFETQEGEIRLSVKKKSDILKNNLFGADIDREATEVAIMSLYLKLLDQGFDKGQGLLFLRGHILPEMS
ncbi:MAG: N-6 DNA methylase, partial [Spirochaetes bacterium]|nr:N-6 DNA methylase [Spirochaetota bacterium]